MVGSEAIADLVTRGGEFYHYYVPPEYVRYPNLAAGGVAVAGIVLAFWGARLLRTIYILSFMVAGSAVGYRVGVYLQIDTLIGLTFGAAIAGFAGYLFYRWWVGATAATFAVLMVLAVASPRILELHQAYEDHRTGLGTDFSQALSGGQTPAWTLYVADMGRYVWKERRDLGMRLGFAVGLASLLGLVMGLMLPKFTTVLGTSVFGVLLVLIGVGVLLSRNLPALWGPVTSHPDWCMVGTALLLVVSVWRQIRPGRFPVVAAAPPEAAPAAPAK